MYGTDGQTIEFTPTHGKRRRVRYKPVPEKRGTMRRIVERHTGVRWVPEAEELVHDVVTTTGAELVDQ